MSTFYGTNDSDTIDGSLLPKDTFRVDARQGDDTLTNIDSLKVFSDPGNDNISRSDFRFLLWYSKEPYRT